MKGNRFAAGSHLNLSEREANSSPNQGGFGENRARKPMSQFTAQQAGGVHPNQRPHVPNGQGLMQWQVQNQQPTMYFGNDTSVTHRQTSTGHFVDVQPPNFQIQPAAYVFQNMGPYAGYGIDAATAAAQGYGFQQVPQAMYGQALPPTQLEVRQAAAVHPQPMKKRERKILEITDPSTGRAIFEKKDGEQLIVEKAPEKKEETNRAEIQAKFSQKVAQRVYSDESQTADPKTKPELKQQPPAQPSPQKAQPEVKPEQTPSPQKPASEKDSPKSDKSVVPDEPKPTVEPVAPPKLVEETPEKIPEVSVPEVPPPKEETPEEPERAKNVYRPPIPKDREGEYNGSNDLNGTADDETSRTPTPDKDAENAEKLKKLEARAEEMYTEEKENIKLQVYSPALIYLVRDVVKMFKKTEIPCSESLLKEWSLHIEGMPALSHNRAKFSNSGVSSVYNFNPQWAVNSGGSGLMGKRQPYPGRHSDSHNRNQRKKGGITGRASLDRPTRPPPVPDTLRKSENAWKPKRRDNTSMDEEDQKYEALRKEIRSIFNKITPSTFDDLSQEFYQMNVENDPKLLKVAIDLIFDKAVEEPKFCALYTTICRAQVDRGTRAEGSFYHTLIQRCQQTFQGNVGFASQIADLKEQMEKEADPKKKADLQENIDLLDAKEKRFLLGNIKFVSHLYASSLLKDVVIDSCIGALYNGYNEEKNEVFLQYAIDLLELVSKMYFANININDKSRENDTVAQFALWLPQIKGAVSSKTKYMIMNYEDLMKNNFVSKKEEKGPKTIAEIRQDVKAEDERKRAERLQYDLKESSRNKGGNRQPYAGRSSIENKMDKRDKRASAAMATMTTGSGPGRKINTSLRNLDNRSLGKTLGPFFQQMGSASAQPEKSADPNGEGEWTTVAGRNNSDSRRTSVERKTSETPTPKGSEPESGGGSRAVSEAPEA